MTNYYPYPADPQDHAHPLEAAFKEMTISCDGQHDRVSSTFRSPEYTNCVLHQGPTRSSTFSSGSDVAPSTLQDDDASGTVDNEQIRRIFNLAEQEDLSMSLANALQKHINEINEGNKPRRWSLINLHRRKASETQARTRVDLYRALSEPQESSRLPPFLQAPAEPGATVRVACPYHKKDPNKFKINPTDGKRFQTCPYGFEDIRRLKDHLTQVHAGPKRCCPNCSATFITKQELMDHLPRKGRNNKKDYKCKPYEDPRYMEDSVLGKRRMEVFTRKGTKVCTRDAWYTIWSLLFSGIQQPESPYKERTLLEVAFDEAQEGVVEKMTARYCKEVTQANADQVSGIFLDEFYAFRNKLFQVHKLQSSDTNNSTMIALQGPGSTFLENSISNAPSQSPPDTGGIHNAGSHDQTAVLYAGAHLPAPQPAERSDGTANQFSPNSLDNNQYYSTSQHLNSQQTGWNGISTPNNQLPTTPQNGYEMYGQPTDSSEYSQSYTDDVINTPGSSEPLPRGNNPIQNQGHNQPFLFNSIEYDVPATTSFDFNAFPVTNHSQYQPQSQINPTLVPHDSSWVMPSSEPLSQHPEPATYPIHGMNHTQQFGPNPFDVMSGAYTPNMPADGMFSFPPPHFDQSQSPLSGTGTTSV